MTDDKSWPAIKSLFTGTRAGLSSTGVYIVVVVVTVGGDTLWLLRTCTCYLASIVSIRIAVGVAIYANLARVGSRGNSATQSVEISCISLRSTGKGNRRLN